MVIKWQFKLKRGSTPFYLITLYMQMVTIEYTVSGVRTFL